MASWPKGFIGGSKTDATTLILPVGATPPLENQAPQPGSSTGARSLREDYGICGIATR